LEGNSSTAFQQTLENLENKVKASKSIVVFNADGTLDIVKPNNDDATGNLYQSTANLWHHRLGRVPFSKLRHILGIPSININKGDSSICVSCPLAKFTHLPYTRIEHSCKVPFGLIHMDIWRLYRVCTHGQCRYVLSIVDDCTRATRTYLLKYKSQALATLQLFCNYVVNHFQHTVKIVRSDNALEFDTHDCQHFFHTHGMVHQISCVDRPQQNGRVERKHRHLLEVSRALRFHASLPLRFWGDCVLTTTYIIN